MRWDNSGKNGHYAPISSVELNRERNEPEFDLSVDAIKRRIASLLRDKIATDRFPLSRRIRSLKTILAKLEQPRQLPAPLPR